MTEIFGPLYSGAYDALYKTKDYGAEADLIERILSREGKPGSRRILDLGCGTGNHSIVLAGRGHEVVGVDRSPAMLALANAKAAAVLADQATLVFQEGNIRDAKAGGAFDAALMMFAVLGYMHEDSDVLAALANARRHLDVGGVFIFDVWNGSAVLADEPKARSLTVMQGDNRLLRETQARLDHDRRVCRVRFELQRTDPLGTIMQVAEDHVMRYFFADELGLMLQSSGFDRVRFTQFPDDRLPLSDSTWNMLGVARAR